jgi:hypothetical protein
MSRRIATVLPKGLRYVATYLINEQSLKIHKHKFSTITLQDGFVSVGMNGNALGSFEQMGMGGEQSQQQQNVWRHRQVSSLH